MSARIYPLALRGTEIVPLEQLTINVASPSAQYGFGLFEGIMAYPATAGGMNIIALKQHLLRMFDSRRSLFLTRARDVGISDFDAMYGIRRLFRANNVNEQVYLRPSLLMSEAADLHLMPVDGRLEFMFSAYLQPCGGYRMPGLNCLVLPMRKPHEHLSRHKMCGNYAYFNEANAVALQSGYDEGIMLDENGLVAEGVYQNMLLEWNGTLIEPQTDHRAILPSITKTIVKRLIAENMAGGRRIIPADVTPQMMCEAQSVILVGTASEVNHVKSIDMGRQQFIINDGRPTAFATELSELYFRFVRGELGHPDLLFHV